MLLWLEPVQMTGIAQSGAIRATWANSKAVERRATRPESRHESSNDGPSHIRPHRRLDRSVILCQEGLYRIGDDLWCRHHGDMLLPRHFHNPRARQSFCDRFSATPHRRRAGTAKQQQRRDANLG